MSIIDEMRERIGLGRSPKGYPQAPSGPAPDMATALKAEQYLIQDVRVIMDNNTAVVVPPLYHEIRTGKLRNGTDREALQRAQRQLERTLHELDREFANTPAGLNVVVAWGLPYFRTYVPGPSFHYLPVDNHASVGGEASLAVLDAIRFPSDPEDVILEDNDFAILLRSDSPDNIATAAQALFDGGVDFWDITSIRRGFIGGGFDGQLGLPKKMAMEAGIPGAEMIPDGAQLFLGFTSSQKASLGGDVICNFESIPGATNQWPSGYFRHGTSMHLSHLYEDLETWYTRFDHRARVDRGFRPGISNVPADAKTIPQGPAQSVSVADNVADLDRYEIVGHSAALQPASRLPTDLIDNYGNFYPQGTSVPQRADFNTLDSPFAWTAHRERDGWSDAPAAGLHFVAFAPTSEGFHRGRMAMDGHYADGSKLAIDPRSPHQGMNAVLRTTHRQNFLVPPRAHRSFPLSEFL